jgi:hypothetical protein
MSFFYTQQQFIDRTKDVTRRKGWRNLKPGERFMAVKKGQGLKPGEKLEYLGECECVANYSEPLYAITLYGDKDVRREGFPHLTPQQFIEMFCEHMGGDANQMVQRIEFKVLNHAGVEGTR